jgi:hypothetical protein
MSEPTTTSGDRSNIRARVLGVVGHESLLVKQLIGILIALVCSWIDSVSAKDELPDLLLPVDNSVAQALDSPDNFHLRDMLYAAKRHRFVRVDADTLKAPGAKFVFRGFDAPLIVETLTADQKEGYMLWSGSVVSRTGNQITFGQSMSAKQYERAVESLYRVHLGTRSFEFELPQTSRAHGGNDNFQLHDGIPASSDKILVTTVMGEWELFESKSLIALMPIEEDPRYHVLMEIDREKRGDGPNRAQRMEEYRQFRETLLKEREDKRSKQAGAGTGNRENSTN